MLHDPLNYIMRFGTVVDEGEQMQTFDTTLQVSICSFVDASIVRTHQERIIGEHDCHGDLKRILTTVTTEFDSGDVSDLLIVIRAREVDEKDNICAHHRRTVE